MQALLSPGSLVTIAGAVLTVIGSIAYLGDNANLSLPTIFYGIPILLGGLALKSSELPPPQRLTAPSLLRDLRLESRNASLAKLLGDLCRWRYGQKAHLESSLEALGLWDEDAPPQLVSVEEFERQGAYGLRLLFDTAGVDPQRWQDRRERLGRFFGPGLQASLSQPSSAQVLLELLGPASDTAAAPDPAAADSPSPPPST